MNRISHKTSVVHTRACVEHKIMVYEANFSIFLQKYHENHCFEPDFLRYFLHYGPILFKKHCVIFCVMHYGYFCLRYTFFKLITQRTNTGENQGEIKYGIGEKSGNTSNWKA